MKKVAIIMGSDSDLPVIEKGIAKLEEFGIEFEVHVFSAHRTPVEAKVFSETARENGFGVIIAAAGMAAHLAGAIAANTTLPVIGIPVKSTNLDGMDALLSTVQMPTGIPVATVAINGAANAALLAIEILAVTDSELAQKLDAMRKEGAETVLKKDAAISAKYSGVSVSERSMPQMFTFTHLCKFFVLKYASISSPKKFSNARKTEHLRFCEV